MVSHAQASDLKPEATHNEEVIQESERHVAGDACLLEESGSLRKIPIPSDSPNDPLNFSWWRKLAVISACCWFSIMSLSLIGSIGMILNSFIEIYLPQGYTMDQVTYLTTMPSLAVGLGNFVILPAALWFGRRPLFLFCTIVLTAASIGAACNQTYEQHLALRIVQGFAAGATESLLPLILSDITFLHQRPLVFAVYWGCQTCISSVLNIAITYVVAAAGWRWYYGLYSIVSGLSILCTFFFAFETRYSRPPAALDGVVVVTDDFGVVRILSPEEAENYHAHHRAQEPEEQDHLNSYVQLLSIWPGPLPEGGKLVLMSYVHMLQCLSSPAIIYAVLVFSITMGSSIGLSLTQDTVFHNLYGWPEKSVGYLHRLSPSSPLRTQAGSAVRSGGFHKPEHHLLLLILPCIIGVIGIVLYAAGAGNPDTLSWGAPYMGWSLYQFSFITVSSILSTFATEVWPMHPGPALVSVVGLKSIIAFGAAYGLQPMVSLHGYEWGYGVLAAIFGAIFMLGVPVYFLNPKWRALMSK